MQIRIGNKQDEAAVRALALAVLAPPAQALDLSGADSDLRSIERHYFGHDGVFLVAEEDRQICGFAAALKMNETTCELKRLCVKREQGRDDLYAQLLNQIISFAQNLDYDELYVASTSLSGAPTLLLEERGFTTTEAGFAIGLAGGPVRH